MNESLKKHELGFMQVNPLPTFEELNDYYSKKYYQEIESATYQSNYSDEELYYINEKISQKDFLINKKNKLIKGKLLDVGCGEGFVLNFYFKKNWIVSGIDFSEYGIKKFHPNLMKFFEKGDIFSLLEQKIQNNEEFDLIWVGNVLEHVLEPIRLMELLRLLLSEDGTLCITVPNDGSKYQEMLLNKNYVDRNWWIAYPDHISYFDNESLLNLANFSKFSCFDLISDFPIDLFLLHSGSNYINDPNQGKKAHLARIALENFIAGSSKETINLYYRYLAKLGLGRDLTIFLNHG